MVTSIKKATEWSDASKYNSFNSYKGLTYYEHYLKIAGWLKGSSLIVEEMDLYGNS